MEGQLFRVRIDLAALQAHLCAEDNSQRTTDEVRRFLVESGFVKIADDWWIVHEANLGVVEPSEVLEAEVIPLPSPRPATTLPTPGELREYEDELDWRENQRRHRRRLSLLAPLAAGVASFAIAAWLMPAAHRDDRK